MADARPPAGLAVLALPPHLAPGDLPALCARLRAMLAATGASAVTCDLRGLLVVDAVTVEAVARLTLEARRAGCRLELRGVPPELCELAEFAGLAGVLGFGQCPPAAPPPGSAPVV